MYKSVTTDKEEGLLEEFNVFDSIDTGETELASISDQILHAKIPTSRACISLQKIGTRKAEALERIADTLAFLRLDNYNSLPGPSGSFKTDPYNLLVKDAKTSEVRQQPFVTLLVAGGTQ
eukprot:2703641-Rhodomonas_salina.1